MADFVGAISVLVILVVGARLLPHALGLMWQGFAQRANIIVQPNQRGIWFRKGVAIKEVGPGKHTVTPGLETIIAIDTRIRNINHEDQAVMTADGSVCVYGFFASTKVEDVGVALRSARNYTQVPEFALLRCARRVLSHSGDDAVSKRQSVEAQIRQESEERLRKAGFALTEFRLNQLQILQKARTAQTTAN